MGDPKKPRKKYDTPRFPWRADRLESELRFLGEHGLRNKRELWGYYTALSRYRKTARSLLAAPTERRLKLEQDLLGGLCRIGVLDKGATIDDVLNLGVEDLLNRRLQTMVHHLGLSTSPWQARQLIVHRHIAVDGKCVTSPSYTVCRGEEEKIGYRGRSPFSSAGHPMRKSISPPAVEPEVESKSVAEDKLGVDTESRRTPGSSVSEQ